MKYKGILLMLVAAAAVLAVLVLPAKANAMPYFEDATVMCESLDVHIRASEDSSVITTLENGARIGVFCEEVSGWYRIIYGNYRGYVKKDDIFLPSTDIISGNARTDSLKIRLNPAGGGKTVGTLNAGYPLRITNILGEWYKISADDIDGQAVEGYVPKDAVMQITAEAGEEGAIVLQEGMEGAEVARMQKALTSRGFFGFSADGEFSSETKRSLKKFQKKADLEVTGVADAATLEVLYSDQDIHSFAQDRGVKGSVMISRWWEVVQYEFAKGAVATITDIRTGKQFKVQRYSGNAHADCEPLTAEDTAIMRSIYGGSWSWDRRAIWVTVGSTTYAASMNGYPHAAHETRISDNGFNGHFCVHFKDSYGHGSNSEDPDHAQCVKDAYYESIS